jgi:hypothetical protein
MVPANPATYVLLARQVSVSRAYQDLMEVRTNPLAFVLFDPIHGQILESLSQEEMLAKLASWPVREPRWWEPSLPCAWISQEGEGWLGWPPGAIP